MPLESGKAFEISLELDRGAVPPIAVRQVDSEAVDQLVIGVGAFRLRFPAAGAAA